MLTDLQHSKGSFRAGACCVNLMSKYSFRVHYDQGTQTDDMILGATCTDGITMSESDIVKNRLSLSLQTKSL